MTSLRCSKNQTDQNQGPTNFARIKTGTSTDIFKRALAPAKKMDRGDRLTPEMRITFEDLAELIRAMTARRVEIIVAVRKQAAAVSDIAKLLHRDGAAVARDVKVLEALGLPTTTLEKNRPRRAQDRTADKYELVATI